MWQRARADNLTVCYREKQMDISFLRICPVLDNEFRHNIVKVICYFDNVETKFMINNKTDAWKTDDNLLNDTFVFSTLCTMFGNVVKQGLLCLTCYLEHLLIW